MTTRRAFIQQGIAASAFAASPFTAAAAAARPRTILVQRDLSESVPFGTEAALQGARVLAVSGDIAGVWMHELEPLLRRTPAVIAGFTGAASLFCLELLARDYGLRPVFRIAHRRRTDGGYSHTLSGRAPRERSQDELSKSGSRWPAAAAVLLNAALRPVLAASDLPLLELEDSGGPAPIYSWMLAPDPRRRGILTRQH